MAGKPSFWCRTVGIERKLQENITKRKETQNLPGEEGVEEERFCVWL
jgi:hypothetical protein